MSFAFWVVVILILVSIAGEMDFEWFEFTKPKQASCAFVILIVLLPLLLSKTEMGEPMKRVRRERSLVALKDNNSINGNSFLFGGNIDEEFYYFYYYQDGTGTSFAKVQADRAIVFDDNTDPRIEYIACKHENGIIGRLLDPTDCLFLDRRKRIYVPEGSITTEYKLDLE